MLPGRALLCTPPSVCCPNVRMLAAVRMRASVHAARHVFLCTNLHLAVSRRALCAQTCMPLSGRALLCKL
eukprot:2639078-Prymnesium_polylepis.1